MKLRSIPPITSTGIVRLRSLDPVRFRTAGTIRKHEPFQIHAFKRAAPLPSKKNGTLEGLLTETENRLRKIMEELKRTCIDELLDELAKLEDIRRQLVIQIMVQRGKTK